MKARIESPHRVAPGGVYENVIFFREGMHLAFDLDAPTAAHFTIERLEPMSAGEVLAYTAGRVLRPGLYVRAVNRSAEAQVFRAQAMTTPDPSALERQVVRAAEDAWSRGGDAVSADDLRLVLEALARKAV